MKQHFKSFVVAILTAEAKLLLRRKKPKVIAITGNVGKTSTKDAIYAAIKDHRHARKSQKSFNSDIGVPLSVLGLPNAWNNPLLWLKNIVDGFFTAVFSNDYPEVLVLEMGVDRPGDMKKLTEWITPDIVVLTRFPKVPVHVEYFTTPEAVVKEKMTLVHALSDDGVVIYNHDDEIIRTALTEVRQKAIGFSRYSPSQFTVSDDAIVYEAGKAVGLKAVLTHIDETVDIQVTGTLGVPQLYVAAAAIATASQLDISLTAAAAGLSAQEPAPGRLRVLSGHNDSTLLDDTYNASPAATEQALLTLQELKCDGKKIAVLGDMLELGQFSVTAHEAVGELAAECCDVLVTIGMRSRKIAEAALENGMSEKLIFQYDDVTRAAIEVKELVEPGDVVLLKGSQGIRVERVTKALLRHQEQAPKLLVRQSQVWDVR